MKLLILIMIHKTLPSKNILSIVIISIQVQILDSLSKFYVIDERIFFLDCYREAQESVYTLYSHFLSYFLSFSHSFCEPFETFDTRKRFLQRFSLKQ